MARRSDNTREEIKKMAVQAGLEILAESGLGGLSARKIADRIGYTVGTLYNVFDDIEDIVLYINAETVQEMHEKLATIASRKKNARQRVLDFAHCYGDYALTNAVRWSLLHTHPRSTPLPGWFHASIQKIFALVEEPLSELTHGSRKATQTAAKVLWAGLHGLCALSINQKLERLEAAPLRALIDNFVGNYLDGMAKR